jgi:hypothetical protein
MIDISFLIGKTVVVYNNVFPSFCVKGALQNFAPHNNSYLDFFSIGDDNNYSYFRLADVVQYKIGGELSKELDKEMYYILVGRK